MTYTNAACTVLIAVSYEYFEGISASRDEFMGHLMIFFERVWKALSQIMWCFNKHVCTKGIMELAMQSLKDDSSPQGFHGCRKRLLLSVQKENTQWEENTDLV